MLRDTYKGIMVLTSGFIASTVNTESGYQNIYVLHSPGAVLGEVAFDQEGQANDSLLTIMETELCYLPAQFVLEAITQDTGLLQELINAAGRNEKSFGLQVWILRGTRLQDRITRFFAARRVEGFGKPSGKLSIPISHEILALVVNSERSSVSRLLKSMESQGLLDIKSRSIVVKEAFWLSRYNSNENHWQEIHN